MVLSVAQYSSQGVLFYLFFLEKGFLASGDDCDVYKFFFDKISCYYTVRYTCHTMPWHCTFFFCPQARASTATCNTNHQTYHTLKWTSARVGSSTS
ncbi:hypothetical protein B9Z19DRAFT_1076801 [Tuber borchii]|uniref:Uncharacterized protein n=1 Tax=Tuber borchii TaxID=42251 RepID=A0A2T7A1E4_TUBBO|nr:hypothetical protein B9Z19DRAFT_1076801 [Tuber borchii]